MRVPSILVAGLTVASVTAMGAPTIPADVWAMKEDASKVAAGAIILEHRLTFRTAAVEHVYRVRVLSEAGKAALSFPAFPESVILFAGRVVHRDGREVVLTSTKDFEDTRFEGSLSGKIRQVRVPGLSSDCVVELSWTDRVAWRGVAYSWRLDSAFPTRTCVVDCSYEIPLFRAIRSMGDTPLNVSQSKDGKILTFTDLPAVPEEPFGLGRPQWVMLECFHLPSSLTGRGLDDHLAFWKAVGQEVYRPMVEAIDHGRTFKRFAEEVLKDLPAGPQAQAREICLRLKTRIRNLDALTVAEAAQQPKGKDAPYIGDLDKLVSAKEGQGETLLWALYKLLEKQGLNPELVFVGHREGRLLDLTLHSAWQWDDVVVAVDEPGRPRLFLDPTLRTAAPGVIRPGYTGIEALALDGRTWEVRKIQVPTPPAEESLRTYRCEVRPQEEGLSFQVKASYTGTSALIQGDAYWRQDETAQVDTLKKAFLRRSRDFQISRAVVKGASDPAGTFGWEVEGSLPMESSRRLTVPPFPGVPGPLSLPSSWPENRRTAIQLGNAFVHSAESRVFIPAGHRLVPQAALNFGNRFGRVSWEATSQPDGQVAVRFQVVLEKTQGAPEAQADLRAFLSALEEAMARRVVLEK